MKWDAGWAFRNLQTIQYIVKPVESDLKAHQNDTSPPKCVCKLYSLVEIRFQRFKDPITIEMYAVQDNQYHK